jgi:hypothetical protein
MEDIKIKKNRIPYEMKDECKQVAGLESLLIPYNLDNKTFCYYVIRKILNSSCEKKISSIGTIRISTYKNYHFIKKLEAV